jgi:hypothetical protein
VSLRRRLSKPVDLSAAFQTVLRPSVSEALGVEREEPLAGNVGLMTEISDPPIKDFHEMPPAKKAQLRKQFDDLNRELADYAGSMGEFIRTVTSFLSRYDPDVLAELIKACGLVNSGLPEIRKIISESTMRIPAANGAPMVETSKMWSTELRVLAKGMELDPEGFVRGMRAFADRFESEERAEILAVAKSFENAVGDGIHTIAGRHERSRAIASKHVGSIAKVDIRNALDQSGLGEAEKVEVLEELLLDNAPTTSIFDVPRKTLVEWGAFIARMHGRDPTPERIRSVFEFANKAFRTRTEAAYPAAARLNGWSNARLEPILEKCSNVIAIAARWGVCGFPLVQPTHKLSASLMATKIPADQVPEIELPWDTFAVLIPEGLLPVMDGSAAVSRMLNRPALIGLSVGNPEQGDERITVWCAYATSTFLTVEPVATVTKLAEMAALSDSPEFIDRMKGLCCRLLLGCLIELDAPKQRDVIRLGPPNRTVKDPRRERMPACWAFDLRRDVTVDLRPWVKTYCETGKDTRPGSQVQVLVRGHQKRQPFGKRIDGKWSSERRWIHVEPYWKGPEDAPIALRSHRMKGIP